MINNNLARAAGLLAISAALAGCSSGPSESDVRKAMNAAVDSMNSQIEEMAGANMANRVGRIEMTDFDLLGCEQAGESYNCDVVYSMNTPLMPIQDRSASVRLRDTDKGWKIVGGLE